jgi:hypothetical protein
MSWEVSYNRALHFVEIVLVGKLDASDLEEATSEVIKLSLEKGCTDFLVDSMEQEGVRSIVDLYRLPQTYHSKGLSQNSRAAVVLSRSPVMRKDSQFWETVCCNLGWKVKSFENRKESIEWLMARDSSNKPDAGDG